MLAALARHAGVALARLRDGAALAETVEASKLDLKAAKARLDERADELRIVNLIQQGMVAEPTCSRAATRKARLRTTSRRPATACAGCTPTSSLSTHSQLMQALYPAPADRAQLAGRAILGAGADS